MIELFYHTTPNARKVLIALEEIGTEYEVRWTDISKGEQFEPGFLAINPNAKIPAIVDHNGPEGKPFALFESGAILLYLAEKFGQLMPSKSVDCYRMMSWLFWQVGGQGPMLGQGAHFISHAPSGGHDIPYAKDRYEREARRHYDVLERELSERKWLVGEEFTIADIAAFPWTRVAKGHAVNLDDYPAVKRWSDRISDRPSANVRPIKADGSDREHGKANYSAQQRDVLFGDGQSRLSANPIKTPEQEREAPIFKDGYEREAFSA